MDGDLLCDFFGQPAFVYILFNGLIKLQLVLFYQLKDGDCRKHFVHRTKVEFGVNVVENMKSFGGFTTGFFK